VAGFQAIPTHTKVLIMEIQSVSKAIRLLEELGKASSGFGVLELARTLEMDKSSVSRLLRTLEQSEIVTQDTGSRRYALGLGLAALGQKALKRLNVRELALPVIRQLADATGECAHLAVLAQGRALYMEQAESPRGIGIETPVGTLAPLYCTALGKVLLAFQSPEKRKTLLSELVFEPYTRRTMTELSVFVSHIETVIRDGVAVDDEEFSVGIRCMAAPVFNHAGQVCGAIGFSGPSPRVTDERMRIWGELIAREAAQLSRKLGYEPAPAPDEKRERKENQSES